MLKARFRNAETMGALVRYFDEVLAEDDRRRAGRGATGAGTRPAARRKPPARDEEERRVAAIWAGMDEAGRAAIRAAVLAEQPTLRRLPSFAGGDVHRPRRAGRRARGRAARPPDDAAAALHDGRLAQAAWPRPCSCRARSSACSRAETTAWVPPPAAGGETVTIVPSSRRYSIRAGAAAADPPPVAVADLRLRPDFSRTAAAVWSRVSFSRDHPVGDLRLLAGVLELRDLVGGGGRRARRPRPAPGRRGRGRASESALTTVLFARLSSSATLPRRPAVRVHQRPERLGLLDGLEVLAQAVLHELLLEDLRAV